MKTRSRGATFGTRIGGMHQLREFRSELLQHRDRKGRRIQLRRAAILFERTSYRFVRRTTVGDVQVSTIWLGFDGGHHWDTRTPARFETMIFGGPFDLDRWQYPTEREAIKGHHLAVAQVTRGARRAA